MMVLYDGYVHTIAKVKDLGYHLFGKHPFLSSTWFGKDHATGTQRLFPGGQVRWPMHTWLMLLVDFGGGFTTEKTSLAPGYWLILVNIGTWWLTTVDNGWWRLVNVNGQWWLVHKGYCNASLIRWSLENLQEMPLILPYASSYHCYLGLFTYGNCQHRVSVHRLEIGSKPFTP